MDAFDPEDFQAACLLVGSITVHWAYLEMSIDQIVTGSFQKLGGNKITRTIPKQFSAKSTYLQSACSGLPALSPFKDRIRQYLTDADALALARNEIVHSAIMTIQSQGDVGFVGIKQGKQTIHFNQSSRSLQQLLDTSNKLQGLSLVGAKLAADVLHICQ